MERITGSETFGNVLFYLYIHAFDKRLDMLTQTVLNTTAI